MYAFFFFLHSIAWKQMSLQRVSTGGNINKGPLFTHISIDLFSYV